MVDVVIPGDLWDEDKEAVVTNWLRPDGARVRQGELVAEIMMEKTQYEIVAPADGTLSVLKAADDIVAKGDIIGRIT